jgi:hypothetical protein
MKTKQTKVDRSAAKLLPGAMALAATTASSQAATVQITLTGNKISSTGGNQLTADLTGDSVDDVSIGDFRVRGDEVFFDLNGGRVRAEYTTTSNYFARAGFTSVGVGVFDDIVSVGPASSRFMGAITFTDNRINGGVVTEAWLEVYAVASDSDQSVEMTRLIFDDASTTRPAFTEIPGTQTEWSAVPEPSSLGLLALGAGGVLLRRRRAKQAA